MAASITVRLTDEVNERLKARVVKNETSVSAFVIEALVSSLDGEDDFDGSDLAKQGYVRSPPPANTEVTPRFKASAVKRKKPGR